MYSDLVFQNQYIYLHEALADVMLFGTHYITKTLLDTVCDYLEQTDTGTGKTRMELQYEV